MRNRKLGCAAGINYFDYARCFSYKIEELVREMVLERQFRFLSYAKKIIFQRETLRK